MPTPPLEESSQLQMRVRAIAYEAPGVLSFELVAVDGQPLPSFDPGAHIDVKLDDRLVRQYSLIGACDGERYVIAVGLDRNSRGGSRRMHEDVRPGQLLTISRPRNTFSLERGAVHTILFAGGIGITPILAMARALRGTGESWTLHYASRSRSAAAFVPELAALGQACRFHFDDEQAALIDIPALIRDAPCGTHFYCCGPAPMISAFRAALADRPAANVHVESFSPAQPQVQDGSFIVELARSGMEIRVGGQQSILDAVLEQGIDVPWSCRSGVCGTCETRVLDGVPEHRDLILSEAERAAGRTMMICCSRALTAHLRLDI